MPDEFLKISLPDEIPPLCVGTREAAHLVGLSERKIWEMVQAGKIPYIKPDVPGGKLLFRVATLDRWLAERETTDPPEKNAARQSTPRRGTG